ncbi:MAG: DUF6529 family protein [Actinomycetota bacterium]
MEEFVDSLTRGNVSQVKSVLATVVAVLAAYQVFLMAVGYGKLRLPFLKSRAASFTHRAAGDMIVVITLLVAFMCLVYFEIEDGIEYARDGETTRAAIHVGAGSLLVATIVLKVIVVRWWHRMGRYLPLLGLTVFGLFIVTWFTSAGNYLMGD